MRRRFAVCVPFLAVLLATVLAIPSSGQDESGEVAQVRRWHAFYRQRAAEFSITEQGNGAVPLTLVPTPLQTWTNPIRGDTQHGTIHLWTHAGRPSVIGSVWSALDPKDRSERALCYEFHSLAQVPVSATLGDRAWWSPREAGVEWLPLADGPKSGPSRAARLRNLRDLAAELRAEIVGDDPQPDTDLRLLSQPLYRYPENTPGVIDGAIFAFVMATDPELFVVLELRRNESTGEPTWLVAPARLTGSALRLRRGERTLWENPTWEYQRDRPYDFLYGVEKQPAALSDEGVSIPSGAPR